MRVAYHINMGIVTHGQISLAAHQQLARLNRIDRAWRRCQGHRLVDVGVVAHDRDAADLQPKPALLLRCSEQPCVLAAVALLILLHAALGTAKDADLERLLLWNQAAIIATAAHNCRRSSRRHGRTERRRASAVVIRRAVVVVGADGRVGVSAVGVQITADLGAGSRSQ